MTVWLFDLLCAEKNATLISSSICTLSRLEKDIIYNIILKNSRSNIKEDHTPFHQNKIESNINVV